MLIHLAPFQLSVLFGLLVIKIRFPLLPIDHSQLTIRLHSRRGCVTATPLLLLLFNPDCFGIKFRLRRNRTKRGGLCSYWFKFEQKSEAPYWFFNVWFCEWAIVNGDLVNGHLREIFPIFPADFRRYSRWLPLIKQIISKLIFNSAVICGKSFLFSRQWWMVKVRPFCCCLTIMLVHPAHFQLSVINCPFTIDNWPFTRLSVIRY